MKKLIPILIFAMAMAVMSHRYSGYDPLECKYQRKERLYYTLMSIGLIMFAGLRVFYNDTSTYWEIYKHVLKKIDTLPSLTDGIIWTAIGDNPGFEFMMRCLARMGVSIQSYFVITSAFTIGVNLWFYRKYSCNLWFSILLFLTYAGFIFNLAAIKQCSAMAMCLIATDRAINKKYLRFLFWVLLGSLFHPYALMYLIVPFLFFRPWSSTTIAMLVIFAVIGAGMQSLVGGLLDITHMLGEQYNAESFTGEGVNPIRLLVTAVPTFISFAVAGQIGKKKEREQYLFMNLTMLNAEIMFAALFGTANYFARLANYFIPFQAVSLPWLFKFFNYEDRQTITAIASICYVLFLVYNCGIQESFDHHYIAVSLWEYLQSLFQEVIVG